MTKRCGVLVAHGRLGEGLLSALTQVVGEQDNLWAVSNKDRAGEELEAEIERMLEARGEGREAFLLSDIDGGSCGQACRRLLAAGRVRAVFYGVNLPLLFEFVFLGEQPYEEFVSAMVSKSRAALGVHT